MDAIPSSVLGSLLHPPQTHGPESNRMHKPLCIFPPDTSTLDPSPLPSSKSVAHKNYHSESIRKHSAVTRTSLITHASGGVTPKDPTPRDSNSLALVSRENSLNLPIGGANATVSKFADTQHRQTSVVQFTALCWCIYIEGWSDGGTGPLLPAFQENYHRRGPLRARQTRVRDSISQDCVGTKPRLD